MDGKCIYWLEELRSCDSGVAGKKCANLGELMQGGFRVPPGFAMSINAYERFMMESGVKDEIAYYLRNFKAESGDMFNALVFERISKDIRAIVESKKCLPIWKTMFAGTTVNYAKGRIVLIYQSQHVRPVRPATPASMNHTSMFAARKR